MIKLWTYLINHPLNRGGSDGQDTCRGDEPEPSIAEHNCNVSKGVWYTFVYLGPGGPVLRHRQ